MQFLVDDYEAQGSGRTVRILVTPALPSDEAGRSAKFYAAKEWHDVHGSLFNVENYDQIDFMQKYERFLPAITAAMINNKKSVYYCSTFRF